MSGERLQHWKRDQKRVLDEIQTLYIVNAKDVAILGMADAKIPKLRFTYFIKEGSCPSVSVAGTRSLTKTLNGVKILASNSIRSIVYVLSSLPEYKNLQLKRVG